MILSVCSFPKQGTQANSSKDVEASVCGLISEVPAICQEGLRKITNNRLATEVGT
jgi:hypothetical protein